MFALSLVGFVGCQQESLSPPTQELTEKSQLANRTEGSKQDNEEALTEEEQTQALASINSIWSSIQDWREGVSLADQLSTSDAIYAFEAIININAGDMRQQHVDRTFFTDVLTAPSPSSGPADALAGFSYWNGAACAGIYDDIVAAVNSHLSNNEGGQSSNRLVAVDVELDPADDTKIWVHTIVEDELSPELQPNFAAQNPNDAIWGDENVVPSEAQVPIPCVFGRADRLIENLINRNLNVSTPPLNLVFGAVRFNNSDAFGFDNMPQGIPLVVDLETFQYPTGSTDFSFEGEFKAHSDKGREEVCFESNKVFSYVGSGVELARDIVRPLVPRGLVPINSFKRLPRSKTPLLSHILSQAGSVAVTTGTGGQQILVASRNHANVFLYGNIVFSAEVIQQSDILNP